MVDLPVGDWSGLAGDHCLVEVLADIALVDCLAFMQEVLSLTVLIVLRLSGLVLLLCIH